jgi:hypothetical protein
VKYIFWDIRVSNHCWAFYSLFWLSKLTSNHLATVTTRCKYFRSGIIYVQNWRVCELLKCILAIQKQPTNRPQLIINQTDHFWDNWKTLKYLNINDSFHLKDPEISIYKRESKARIPITFCCLIFVNCGFLNIKKVKI